MDENKELENQQPQEESYIPDPAENSGTEQAGEDSGAQAVDMQPVTGGTAEAAAPAPKGGKGMYALIGVAAALVILIVAVLVAGGLGKKPEDAVKAAFSKTGAELQVISEQLINEMPFYQLFMPQQEARSGKFTFSIDSVDMGMEGMQAELINAMLKMFSFSADTVNDPAGGISEMNGKLNMGSTALLDFFVQLSPDQLAFHMPKFSDTVLSINPNTLVEDMQSSPLFDDTYMDEETLRQMQDMLSMEMKYFSMLGNLDYQKMSGEMYEIMNGVYVNAVYEKAAREGNQKVYTVLLDGEQVKQTLIALANYIYLDSDLGQIYQGAMGDMIRETILDPMEQEIPALPTTMVVKVGADGLITELTFNVDTAAFESSEESSVDEISLRYVFSNGITAQNMNVLVSGTNHGEPVSLSMDINADYADGNCKADMAFVADINEISFDMKMDMSMDKAGPVNIGLDYGIGSEYTEIDVGAAIEGTVTKEADTLTWDFPVIKMEMGSAEPAMQYSFAMKANGEATKLDTPAQPAANTKPLFSMTEEELYDEMMKYQAGLEAMVNDAVGGAMFSGGAAPEADAPAA